MGCRICLVFLFLDVYLEVALLSHMVVFGETFILFPTVVAPTGNSHQPHSLYFTSLSTFICSLFDDRHSDWCEVISRGGFDLHFPDD